MGAASRLICTFTLRAPAHVTGATRTILLIQRNGCQAERLLFGATVNRQAGTPPRRALLEPQQYRCTASRPRASRLCTPADRGRAYRHVVDAGSPRGEWLGAAYGRDDVVDCLAGRGRVGFVVEKRLVGRVMGNTVQAVGGQCGHMFLRRLPFRVVPGVGGEDDERLTVEISQQRRLMGRRGRREDFLDPASEMSGGC